MAVRSLATTEAFETLLSSSGDKLVVVYFFAADDEQNMQGGYEALAEESPECVFAKVDVDENKGTGVTSPAFKVFENGIVVGMVVGLGY